MSNLTETADLRAELVEVTAERDALRAQLDGDLPAATRRLQRKVWRQAAALDALNRRVTSQRFALRTLDELGRSLTATEYRAARPSPSTRQPSTGQPQHRPTIAGQTTARRAPQESDGRAAASKAACSGFDSRLGHHA